MAQPQHKYGSQIHLNYSDRVNLGSYYTPNNYVEKVWGLIKPYISKNTVILDSSCGYGNFFINSSGGGKIIGNDIDLVAVNLAKQKYQEVDLYNHNALYEVGREKFGINVNDKLIIIGNPPYNDKTSIIRSHTKKDLFEIDSDLKSRDLGISFLLSYSKLKADYICVLHPLSYLIKKSNFELLKKFSNNYKLINGIIISSACFSETSKIMSFPIVIALYERNSLGMNYNQIENFSFKTDSGKIFSLNNFNYIGKLLNKYPTTNYIKKDNDIFFYTMRDLNALKRSKTFLSNYGSNTIVVDKNKLELYMYVDVVKDFNSIFPYYLGNCDVIIDLLLYKKYRDYFISYVCKKHPFLKQYISYTEHNEKNEKKIDEYFRNLLKEHYVTN